MKRGTIHPVPYSLRPRTINKDKSTKVVLTPPPAPKTEDLNSKQRLNTQTHTPPNKHSMISLTPHNSTPDITIRNYYKLFGKPMDSSSQCFDSDNLDLFTCFQFDPLYLASLSFTTPISSSLTDSSSNSLTKHGIQNIF
ncbi:hypothetical protein DID74_00610 [Candidatus Marinamargulisbacteria bacterium SCGC AG-333-B06]|nr:hypothetical protein DID74_00610 [Candidatus Marinamargulisbacteria bacterium SCGC AG-333-B06]